MNQNKLTSGAILILCFSFFFLSMFPLSWGEMEGDERPPFSHMVRRMFSSSAENLRTVMNQAQAYFFPPNLDFRGGSSREGRSTKEKMMEGGAPEEKLKEAIAESMGKTKATVEESAKSAAEIATKTIKEAKEKVKRSLSSPHQEPPLPTEEL